MSCRKTLLMKIDKVIKNMIVKVMKKRFIKYFLLDVKCVSGVSCKTNENENSSLFSMHLFYANYFMKIGCFKSLKKSSKQSIFSKVTGLQGCRPVNLVKVAPFHWCFPRNLTKRCKLVILYQHVSCGYFCKSWFVVFTEKEGLY